MTGLNLSERLAENRGGPIEYKNRKVFMAYETVVLRNQIIDIEFVKFNKSVKQGIEMSMDRSKGYLQVIDVDNEKIKHPIFWTDTAPSSFRVKCLPRKKEGTLLIWNIWIYPEEERIDAWIGNSGLYIEKVEDNVSMIHCSNGIGRVNFDDLVFKVKKC